MNPSLTFSKCELLKGIITGLEVFTLAQCKSFANM